MDFEHKVNTLEVCLLSVVAQADETSGSMKPEARAKWIWLSSRTVGS